MDSVEVLLYMSLATIFFQRDRFPLAALELEFLTSTFVNRAKLSAMRSPTRF
jgi:hypothetical protein